MKLKFSLPLVVGMVLLAGCGKKDDSTASPAPAAAPTSSSAAIVAVEITANDTMKYNLTRIEANVGQEVKITLTNTGTLPKTVMGHNLIVLKKGGDLKAYTDAAVTAAATDYIPASMADKVIAHTKLLGAKQSDEISFKLTEALFVYFPLAIVPLPWD